MFEFSFIDFGLKDFIRTDDGKVLILPFNSYFDADLFVEDGGLEQYGWTNEGTVKWCWNEEVNSEDVP